MSQIKKQVLIAQIRRANALRSAAIETMSRDTVNAYGIIMQVISNMLATV